MSPFLPKPIMAIAGLLYVLASTASAATTTPYEHGRKLIELNCQHCHATGLTGESPLPIAPPFREIADYYDQADLADSFMDGLAVSHKDMPDWKMTEPQAAALATYIMSLKSPQNTAPATFDKVNQGQALLESQCASCHAVKPGQKSPLAQAPVFSELVTRYDPADIEEALAEGIVTGHNNMPEFTFTPEQIEAIIAYLGTLQATQKQPR